MTSSTVSALPQQSEAARILNSTRQEKASGVHPSIVLLGRFLFSLIFSRAAAGDFSKETLAYAAAQGVPSASITVPFCGIIALLGRLSILFGYRSKIGAWIIVLFLIPVSLAMHKFWGVTDPMMAKMQMAHFMKNVSILAGCGKSLNRDDSPPQGLKPSLILHDLRGAKAPLYHSAAGFRDFFRSLLGSLTLSSTQLQALSLGTHYAVVWDWLWDNTAQCYKGPGLNQCNTGSWRVQSFSLTSSATPTPSPTPTYTYSQSSYYAYSQSAYTGGTNVAPQGTAYRWHSNTVSTADTNKVAAAALNDNDLTVDVNLNGATYETLTAFEAG